MSLCQETALDMAVHLPGQAAWPRIENLPVAAWELVGQVVATQKLSGLMCWLAAMTAGDPCQRALLQALTSACQALPPAWAAVATEVFCNAMKDYWMQLKIDLCTGKLGCPS